MFRVLSRSLPPHRKRARALATLALFAVLWSALIAQSAVGLVSAGPSAAVEALPHLRAVADWADRVGGDLGADSLPRPDTIERGVGSGAGLTLATFRAEGDAALVAHDLDLGLHAAARALPGSDPDLAALRGIRSSAPDRAAITNDAPASLLSIPAPVILATVPGVINRLERVVRTENARVSHAVTQATTAQWFLLLVAASSVGWAFLVRPSQPVARTQSISIETSDALGASHRHPAHEKVLHVPVRPVFTPLLDPISGAPFGIFARATPSRVKGCQAAEGFAELVHKSLAQMRNWLSSGHAIERLVLELPANGLVRQGFADQLLLSAASQGIGTDRLVLLYDRDLAHNSIASRALARLADNGAMLVPDLGGPGAPSRHKTSHIAWIPDGLLRNLSGRPFAVRFVHSLIDARPAGTLILAPRPLDALHLSRTQSPRHQIAAANDALLDLDAREAASCFTSLRTDCRQSA